MATGYTRTDTTNNIADGNIINAADLDNEFDGVQAAFNNTTGHDHDGTTGGGAPINKVGPSQDVVISTSAITPKTTNVIDLGSSLLQFKDLWIDGVANIDTAKLTTIQASDGTAAGSIADSTGVVTLNSAVLTTVDINAGAIDGTTIGSTTAAAGSFTTLSASGAVTVGGNTTLGDASTDTVTVNGYMGVGGAGASTVGLYLTSNALTGGTGHDGIYSAVTGTSSATSRVAGFVSQPGTAASAYTVTDVIGIRLRDATKGSGSTITNMHGAYINDLTVGTNNYGITSLVSSGTNKWNIYASGTAANYFAGNVGIGTSSPAYKLDVDSGSTDASALFNSTSANGSHIRLASSGTVKNYIGNAAGFITSGSADDLGLRAVGKISFATNGAAADMTIDASGNLGLGVTPSGWGAAWRAFDNFGAGLGASTGGGQTIFTQNAYNNGTNYIYKYAAPATAYHQIIGEHRWLTAPYGTTGNAMTFNQVMTLDASGRLGVGVTSPSQKLDVFSGTASSAVAQFTGANAGRGLKISTALVNSVNDAGVILDAQQASGVLMLATGGTERARITSSGDFLVGTTSTNPSSGGIQLGNLSWLGGAGWGMITSATSTSSSYVGYFKNPNGAVGSIIVSGSSTSYNTSSDYRLKEDWVAVSDASTRVNALKPVNFAWKADGKRVDGFLAHELAEVVPEAVTGDKDAVDADGNPVYQGIDQSKLVPLLTAALQEALARVESLESRLTAAGL